MTCGSRGNSSACVRERSSLDDFRLDKSSHVNRDWVELNFLVLQPFCGLGSMGFTNKT